MSWEGEVGEKVDLLLGMLAARAEERVLDLACATGGIAIELSRRGFSTIGVDPREDLLEIAGWEAEAADVWPYFFCEDPREVEFRGEFDLVLSVNGGAFGHRGDDAEDIRGFEAAARALRPGGRLLMQVPCLPHLEQRLPPRTWFTTGETMELIEAGWNAGTRRIEGAAVSVECAQELERREPHPFQRRVYSVEELAAIFERVGLRLLDVYDEHGKPCTPTVAQRELYVVAGR